MFLAHNTILFFLVLAASYEAIGIIFDLDPIDDSRKILICSALIAGATFLSSYSVFNKLYVKHLDLKQEVKLLKAKIECGKLGAEYYNHIDGEVACINEQNQLLAPALKDT